MKLTVEIKQILKLDYIDVKQALENKPLKREQKNANYILRAFIKAVRKNSVEIFGNNEKVDFHCNGYKQVISIKNNNNTFDFLEVLKNLFLTVKV